MDKTSEDQTFFESEMVNTKTIFSFSNLLFPFSMVVRNLKRMVLGLDVAMINPNLKLLVEVDVSNEFREYNLHFFVVTENMLSWL